LCTVADDGACTEALEWGLPNAEVKRASIGEETRMLRKVFTTRVNADLEAAAVAARRPPPLACGASSAQVFE